MANNTKRELDIFWPTNENGLRRLRTPETPISRHEARMGLDRLPRKAVYTKMQNKRPKGTTEKMRKWSSTGRTSSDGVQIWRRAAQDQPNLGCSAIGESLSRIKFLHTNSIQGTLRYYFPNSWFCECRSMEGLFLNEQYEISFEIIFSSVKSLCVIVYNSMYRVSHAKLIVHDSFVSTSPTKSLLSKFLWEMHWIFRTYRTWNASIYE